MYIDVTFCCAVSVPACLGQSTNAAIDVQCEYNPLFANC